MRQQAHYGQRYPGHLGHFGAGPKAAHVVEQLGVHKQDHREAGAFDRRHSPDAHMQAGLIEELALEGALDRLVAFQPATR
jgi:hypothetical protein